MKVTIKVRDDSHFAIVYAKLVLCSEESRIYINSTSKVLEINIKRGGTILLPLDNEFQNADLLTAFRQFVNIDKAQACQSLGLKKDAFS